MSYFAGSLAPSETRVGDDVEPPLAEIEAIGGFGHWAAVSRSAIRLSPEARRIHGLDPGGYAPTDQLLALYDEEGRERLGDLFSSLLDGGDEKSIEANLVTVRGDLKRVRWRGCQTKNRGKVIGVVRDISEEHDRRVELEWAADYDQLTRLLNRRAFHDIVWQQLACGEAERGWIAILDFDNMKMLNDVLGHAAGDAALRHAAATMRKVMPFATLARLGGDEFAIFYPGNAPPGLVKRTSDQLIEALCAPVEGPFGRFEIGCTIGAAEWQHGEDFDTAMRRADIALYHGKEGARGSTNIYRSGLPDPFQRRTAQIELLKSALTENRMKTVFLPIIDIRSRMPVDHEALARIDKDGELVPASDFAEALDDPASTGELLRRMLENCAEAARGRRIRFSINVSPSDLAQAGFVRQLQQDASEAGLDPDRITIEITERAILAGTIAQLADITRRVRDAGFGLALDDFGTGFSSLTHLSDLPISRLKIDGSFVARLDCERRQMITLSVIGLAKSLGIDVVAEGVESEHQAAILQSAGCMLMQGHLFGLPQHTVQTGPALERRNA